LGVGVVGLGLRMRMGPEANNFELVWRNGEVKDPDRARCFELLQEVQTMTSVRERERR